MTGSREGRTTQSSKAYVKGDTRGENLVGCETQERGKHLCIACPNPCHLLGASIVHVATPAKHEVI